MSYIEDVETGDGISRLYAFSDDSLNPDIDIKGRFAWYTRDQLHRLLGENDTISHAFSARMIRYPMRFNPGNAKISFGAKARQSTRVHDSSSERI